LEAVAGAGIEIEGVELLQLLNALERGRTEGNLAVEGVEHDAFEQIAQGHVVIFGESLEHFEQPLFHADAGLDSFDEELRFVYHGTNVPWYILRSKGSEHQDHFPCGAALLDSQPAMGAVDDIAVGDLAMGGEDGLRHLKHIAEHERGCFLLLGKANLRCSKLRHASGLDSAGWRVPMDPDPQGDGIKAGGK